MSIPCPLFLPKHDTYLEMPTFFGESPRKTEEGVRQGLRLLGLPSEPLWPGSIHFKQDSLIHYMKWLAWKGAHGTQCSSIPLQLRPLQMSIQLFSQPLNFSSCVSRIYHLPFEETVALRGTLCQGKNCDYVAMIWGWEPRWTGESFGYVLIIVSGPLIKVERMHGLDWVLKLVYLISWNRRWLQLRPGCMIHGSHLGRRGESNESQGGGLQPHDALATGTGRDWLVSSYSWRWNVWKLKAL